MAEIKVFLGEVAQTKVLRDVLITICKRVKTLYANPVTIGYYEPQHEIYVPLDHPYFYIEEVKTTYLLRLIPRRQTRVLFAINPGFYGEAFGVKEIHCSVSDKAILPVVTEEIQKYADSFQVSTINMIKTFVE